MSQAQVDKFLVDLRDTLGKLENLPVPTIAAIDGPALGGGLELSLACDLRVAGTFALSNPWNNNSFSPGHSVTTIGLPETRLGIIPGAGGTQRTTRLLGPSKAKDLIFTARALSAEEALSWGTVNSFLLRFISDKSPGLVDYISSPGSSGFDRALSLAESIAINGMTYICPIACC